MRLQRSSFAAVSATLVTWLVPLVSCISVPTGKLTPITPARPTPRSINPQAPSDPAPVVEYSQDHPEPPPLDPSYVPQTFNYFDTLAKHHIFYFPVRYRNFNAISNHIEYEPPQKYVGHTLGKNIGYKSYKQQLSLPYYPGAWNNQQGNQYSSQQGNQYNSQQQANQYNSQQQGNQYNSQQQANQYNSQQQATNQFNNLANDQYNQGSTQYNNQYNPQPVQQQQQYEAVSTQSSPASTVAAAPQVPQGPQTSQVPKVDYSKGKGSYDVTGKGGSKSEYYTKEDWSKKTVYPKKVVTTRKYPGSKY